MIPIIDICAGPGGLGEGFSSLLDDAGTPVFKIKLSIEKEEHAHRTLQLRAFYRQFPRAAIPAEYYEVLRTERSIEGLYELYPSEAARAKAEAIRETLGSDSWDSVSTRIKSALKGERNWLLIGGPPCQAYSLVGRARNKNKKGYKPKDDEKHFLYKEYLRIIASFWPAVFVMENVKGLLSSKPDPKEDPIFARILLDLSAPAESQNSSYSGISATHKYKLYSLSPRRTTNDPAGSDFILRAEEHGVPQARHRVIIVGVRDDFSSYVPDALALTDPVAISRVLKHMPKLRSGITDKKDSDHAWLEALSNLEGRRWFKTMRKVGPEGMTDVAINALRTLNVPPAKRGSEFVSCAPSIDYRPDWYLDPQLAGVCNHSSRAHITKDLYRYFYAACFAMVEKTSPKLADFPADLLPDHKNVADAIIDHTMFLDRFRVQPWGRPSTTVTSHISKDGHYYIHPDPKQVRSLTVREAARLQSFPDNYLFTGPRTAQYIQVGNAVPPLLARSISQSIAALFCQARIGGS
jgi:DNA (cytosine-5)-methyltransferase 1